MLLNETKSGRLNVEMKRKQILNLRCQDVQGENHFFSSEFFHKNHRRVYSPYEYIKEMNINRN